MKLGVEDMWGDSLAHYEAILKLADALAYDIVAVGDVPAGFRDLYLNMAIAARETRRAAITSFVTGPFLRHPLVVANAFSTLQDLSGGRMVLGLARGGGNVLAVGRKPATQKEMGEYWDALDDLFAGRPANYEGRAVSPLHNARSTPVMYSAFGPRAFQLAAERADGVIMFTDGDLDKTREQIRQYHQFVKQAGRNPEDVEIWVTAFCSIRDDRQQALEDIKAYLVTNALTFIHTPDKWARVPEHIREKLLKLADAYDYTEHSVVNGNNVRALNAAGPDVIDYLTSIHTVAGTPSHVKSIIDGLEEMGVSAFITNTSGHADPYNHLETLAKLVKS